MPKRVVFVHAQCSWNADVEFCFFLWNRHAGKQMLVFGFMLILTFDKMLTLVGKYFFAVVAGIESIAVGKMENLYSTAVFTSVAVLEFRFIIL